MIKLNRMTDYGVVILGVLGQDPTRKLSAAELALKTAIPAPSVAKVLHLLAQEGILSAQRGAAGGYGLARPAADISIASVIEALEGPIALTACVEGGEHLCGSEDLCPMRGNWDKVNRSIREALAAVSLAEMQPDWGRLEKSFVGLSPLAGKEQLP